MTEQHLVCHHRTRGSVLYITFNRPDKIQQLQPAVGAGASGRLDRAANEANIRAVYMTNGKAFCAGWDLSEAIAPDGPGIQRIVRRALQSGDPDDPEPEKPVICAVNGVAASTGANIALACDIVIAGKSASFIQAFSKDRTGTGQRRRSPYHD